VLLDDYSHLCWLFPLNHKSDVHCHIVYFVAYAQTQFSAILKSFQADNSTKFINNTIVSMEINLFPSMTCFRLYFLQNHGPFILESN